MRWVRGCASPFKTSTRSRGTLVTVKSLEYLCLPAKPRCCSIVQLTSTIDGNRAWARNPFVSCFHVDARSATRKEHEAEAVEKKHDATLLGLIPSPGTRAVVFAIAGNSLVCLTKFGAAFVTSSGVMFAEGKQKWLHRLKSIFRMYRNVIDTHTSFPFFGGYCEPNTSPGRHHEIVAASLGGIPLC